jgi:hypothetical protein
MRNTRNNKTLRKKKGEGNPKVYYSSTAIRAVSTDGGKKWHVDANINGDKRHVNLTKHDIMDVLAYPASPKDLRTRLLEDFDMGTRDVRNERNERNEGNERNVRNERNERNTRKKRNRNRKYKVKV